MLDRHPKDRNVLTTLRNKLRSVLINRWNLENKLAFGTTSYSQEGEDTLLWRLMDRDHSAACFVDVGSNHPFRMSNTAFFYERGWRGVAIDPNPSFKSDYTELRPADRFINCGVGRKKGQLTYFQFEEPLYNTFCAEKAVNIEQEHSKKIKEEIVPIRRLDEILGSVWPNGQSVRVLSVDCEGMDTEVLQSHDFDKYPVEFACVEVDSLRLDSSAEAPPLNFLEGQGFIPISKLCKSVILVHSGVIERWGLQL